MDNYAEAYRKWAADPSPENLEAMVKTFKNTENPESKLSYSSDGGKFICHFKGEMDTVTAMAIEKDLLDKITAIKTNTIFDFDKVEYIASGFLRICLKAAQVIGKDNFSIINVPPSIGKVLKMAGFDNIVRISYLKESSRKD